MDIDNIGGFFDSSREVNERYAPYDLFSFSHFVIPFTIYYFTRLFWVSLALVYIWESVEHLIYKLFDTYPFIGLRGQDNNEESKTNSLLLDPFLGLLGILCALVFVDLFNIDTVRDSRDVVLWLQVALYLVASFSNGTRTGYYLYIPVLFVFLFIIALWNEFNHPFTYIMHFVVNVYFTLWFIGPLKDHFAWNAYFCGIFFIFVVSMVYGLT